MLMLRGAEVEGTEEINTFLDLKLSKLFPKIFRGGPICFLTLKLGAIFPMRGVGSKVALRGGRETPPCERINDWII